jgi:hypothetical protein
MEIQTGIVLNSYTQGQKLDIGVPMVEPPPKRLRCILGGDCLGANLVTDLQVERDIF